MQAGATREAELVIPYRHYLDAIEVAKGQSIGSLTLTVFNGLLNGPTVVAPNDIARINLFISFMNADFQVLNPSPSTLDIIKVEAEMRVESAGVRCDCGMVPDVRYYFIEMGEDGVDTIIKYFCSTNCRTGYVGHAADCCLVCRLHCPESEYEEVVSLEHGGLKTTMPRRWCSAWCAELWDDAGESDEDSGDDLLDPEFDPFEQEVQLEAQMGAMQSGLAKAKSTVDYAQGVVSKASIMAGELDKPNIGQNTVQVVRKKYPVLANIDTVSQASVLDAFTVRHDLPSVAETGTREDEMDLRHLLEMPSWYATVRISDSDLTGALVWVAPMTINPRVMVGPAIGQVQPTLMGYVATPFSFWQSDIVVTLEYVASKVQTTRVFFGIIYAGVATGIPFDQITGQYGLSIDFNAANTTVKIRIPYRTNLQQLRVPRVLDTNPETCSLGEMGLWIINPLVSSESVAATADINIFVNTTPCEGRSDFGLQYMGGNVYDFAASSVA
jgi:hypothetical protein